MHQSNDKEDETSSSAGMFAELPNQQYQTALNEIIKNNFESPIEDLKVEIAAGSAKGDNYSGILYRISVDDSKGKQLKVIVKIPPTSPARREQFFSRPTFIRESLFYNDIYPMFKQFQEDKGINVKEDGFHQVPVCYKALDEEFSEGIFLEDLRISGFDMFDRFKETTADHVNLVMKTLGKFHAISLAMKERKPELFNPFRDIVDIFFSKDEASLDSIRVWYDMPKKQAIEALESLKNPDLINKAKKVLDIDFLELMKTCIFGSLAEPYAVLCHGDCWNNNIMFRNQNDIPAEVRLLDWQVLRYAPPVCDLLYYIFGCTTKALRDKHYNEFLNTYHKSLSDFLIRLGSDPKKLFPREVLNDQLKRFGKFGLAMAVMVLPIFTSNADDIPDLDEMSRKLQNMQDNGEQFNKEDMQFTSEATRGAYDERMTGVFQDMFDFGYI